MSNPDRLELKVNFCNLVQFYSDVKELSENVFLFSSKLSSGWHTYWNIFPILYEIDLLKSLIAFLSVKFLCSLFGRKRQYAQGLSYICRNGLSTWQTLVNFNCHKIISNQFLFLFLFALSKSEQERLNLIEWIHPVTLFFFTIIIIFLLCELCEMVTSQFRMLNVKLCQRKWYLFPIEVQRMLVIFISDTQQPVYIRGFGNISCTRQTFKKVHFIFLTLRMYLEQMKWNNVFFFILQTINGGFSYFMMLQRVNRFASSIRVG